MSDIILNGITYPAGRKVAFPGTDGNEVVFDLPEDADSGLNSYSERPVQNKVIHAAVQDLRQRQTSPFNFKGSCTYASLPATAEINDTWYLTDLKYRVTWTGEAWQQSSMDESDYEDELAALKNDVIRAEDLLGAADLFFYTSITPGQRLTDTGEAVSASEYVTTDYIPVDPQKVLYLRHKGGTVYTQYRCTYDANKELISYWSHAADPDESYLPPENAAFIRYSVSQTVWANGVTLTTDTVVDELRLADTYLSLTTGKENFISPAGFVVGKLNNTGEINRTAIDFVTTAMIPVREGGLYSTEVGSDLPVTIFRCYYDADEEFAGYVSYEQSNQDGARLFVTPRGVAYVRFSFSLHARDTGFVFRQGDAAGDRLTKSEARVRAIEKALHTESLIDMDAYTAGRFVSDGTIEESDYFITTDFIPVTAGWEYLLTMDGTSAYDLWRCTYDADKQLVSYVHIEAQPERSYIPPSEVAYVRFSVSYAVMFDLGFRFCKRLGTLDLLHAAACPTPEIHAYTGNALPLERRNAYSIEKIYHSDRQYAPSGLSLQAFEIYDGILFQFLGEDMCRVIDMANDFATISEFASESEHANSCQFSDVFYDAGDRFPLCYVAGIDTHVRVLRFANDLSGCTLVRTLTFDPEVYGYYARVVFDRDSGRYYTVGSTTSAVSTPGAVVCEVDIETLAVQNSFRVQFGMTVVALQGCKALDGHIFMAHGGHSDVPDTFIHVVSIEEQAVVTRLSDFPDVVKKYELEDIAFVPNRWAPKYDMILQVESYGYWRLSV